MYKKDKSYNRPTDRSTPNHPNHMIGSTPHEGWRGAGRLATSIEVMVVVVEISFCLLSTPFKLFHNPYLPLSPLFFNHSSAI